MRRKQKDEKCPLKKKMRGEEDNVLGIWEGGKIKPAGDSVRMYWKRLVKDLQPRGFCLESNAVKYPNHCIPF